MWRPSYWRSDLGRFKHRIYFWNGVGDSLHFRQISVLVNTKQPAWGCPLVYATLSRPEPIYRKDLSLWIKLRYNCILM
jgi:hypothetical protein